MQDPRESGLPRRVQRSLGGGGFFAGGGWLKGEVVVTAGFFAAFGFLGSRPLRFWLLAMVGAPVADAAQHAPSPRKLQRE
jgi:hypothetical protein